LKQVLARNGYAKNAESIGFFKRLASGSEGSGVAMLPFISCWITCREQLTTTASGNRERHDIQEVQQDLTGKTERKKGMGRVFPFRFRR
jgi:hypothetical protein